MRAGHCDSETIRSRLVLKRTSAAFRLIDFPAVKHCQSRRGFQRSRGIFSAMWLRPEYKTKKGVAFRMERATYIASVLSSLLLDVCRSDFPPRSFVRGRVSSPPDESSRSQSPGRRPEFQVTGWGESLNRSPHESTINRSSRFHSYCNRHSSSTS